ncbi:glycosyltransferase family A protein [Chryseobacterium sp. W4I1]|uniref:glycosyltransferase family 2 protein n=1 Tax=Chryseobacterium sp. W4I1 TaxID=3042293 RepID=UPI0027801C42|nr:glycosyltransferase family A protein [Chryseobacterium sp. W4I1]MDQ0782140.1 glycosyltransferase involved in cell wall biosynthesis [Chryseobacterium sp. W4I1]
MISVVIPLYNKEKYIKETILKVLNQTYQHFEIIIINDGSKDKGPDIVNEINDSRIKLFNKNNGGVSSARNLGIEKSQYEYIAFLDADDEWLPNHLEEINKLITKYKNSADIFVTNFARKYVTGNLINNRKPEELKEGIIIDYFKKVIRKGIIHTSCVCVSKKALLKANLFDERLSRGEDMDLWMRLAKEFGIAYSPVITEVYLQEAENNSKVKSDVTRSIIYHLDFSTVTSIDEKRYLKNLLYRKYASLLKNIDFSNFIKLMIKQGF